MDTDESKNDLLHFPCFGGLSSKCVSGLGKDSKGVNEALGLKFSGEERVGINRLRDFSKMRLSR
jgi:hypothetical protein